MRWNRICIIPITQTIAIRNAGLILIYPNLKSGIAKKSIIAGAIAFESITIVYGNSNGNRILNTQNSNTIKSGETEKNCKTDIFLLITEISFTKIPVHNRAIASEKTVRYMS